MSVRKIDNSYCVFIKGKHSISYSVNHYGDYAKILAEKSDITHIRYDNYYEEDENNDKIMIMRIYSKKYGYLDVIFNKRHYNKVKKYRWHVNKDNDTFYCNSARQKGKPQQLLHRLVMNYTGKLQIDHKDRNGLNNLDNNLRVVSHSTNMRNKEFPSKHKIWTNVAEYYPKKQNPYFRVIWTTLSGNAKYKFYIFNEDNYKEQKHKAISKSIAKRSMNGYHLSKEDISYAKEHNIKVIRRW